MSINSKEVFFFFSFFFQLSVPHKVETSTCHTAIYLFNVFHARKKSKEQQQQEIIQHIEIENEQRNQKIKKT